MAISKRRLERNDEELVRLYLTDVGQHVLSKNDQVRLVQQIEAASLAGDTLTQRGRTISPIERRTLRRTVRRGEEAQRRSC